MNEREHDQYISETPAPPSEPAPAGNALPKLGQSGSSGLGSLAQKTRRKSLKGARGILVWIGVLTVLANLLFILIMPSQIDKEIQAEIKKMGPGVAVDQQALQEFRESALRAGILIDCGFIAMGVVFIVLGALVYRYPVPATVLGLVLYLAGGAMMALFEPEMLARGIIVRIIILVFFFKAVKTAIAYQREEREARALELSA